MTTTTATIVGLVVLSSAGFLPTIGLVGFRIVAMPLVPLGGAVMAALAATCFMALGGNFLGWFGALGILGVLVVAVIWIRHPERRPWRSPDDSSEPTPLWFRIVGVVGALAILGVCIWNLRGLATPTVGFDARALWLLRSGWFLQSHQQLLIDMKAPYLSLGQTPYPPLVSAAPAVAWGVTGDHSLRLGVVLIALLNTCALAVAAFAFVESGRRFTQRIVTGSGSHGNGIHGTGTQRGASPPLRHTSLLENRLLAPLVMGIACAVLLVFVAFGITEPFMTNGYADPIWSLAAVGALAYGLQMEINRVNQGVTLILLLVAGMSKNEGWATAATLIVLLVIRGLVTMSTGERRLRWWNPVLVGAIEMVAISAWPIVMQVVHGRGVSMPYSPLHQMADRLREAFDGMTPYLHVIVLAAPLAVVGGVLLSGVRRRSGAANDWWAWAGLAGGLLAICAGYVTSTANIHLWLVGTVDRVTEFSTLAGWWIVAMWVMTSSLTPAVMRAWGHDLPSDQLDGSQSDDRQADTEPPPTPRPAPNIIAHQSPKVGATE